MDGITQGMLESATIGDYTHYHGGFIIVYLEPDDRPEYPDHTWTHYLMDNLTFEDSVGSPLLFKTMVEAYAFLSILQNGMAERKDK